MPPTFVKGVFRGVRFLAWYGTWVLFHVFVYLFTRKKG